MARSEANPASFQIPGETDRASLEVGQGVKLLFWIDSAEDHTPVCERMWVLITQRFPDGRYDGVLENEPETPGGLSKGQRVVFGAEHVAEIYPHSTGYEEGSRRGDG